ncbi:MAG: FAD-dependent oxidoreductase [Pseudomonadota bacterium]
MTRIAVIGAGLAGLACARRLRKGGADVVVFEKSRGLGGRLATRRRDAYAFDHGAQYLTARDERFGAALAEVEAAGAAAKWAAAPEGREWWVGAPGMSGLVKPWAEGLTLHLSARLHTLQPTGGGAGWRLQLEEGAGDDAAKAALTPFGAVVLAIPAPQAEEILARSGAPCAAFAKRLAPVRLAPCWAAMAAFAEPLPLAAHTLKDAGAAVSWAARNSHKPGRPHGADQWVLHASPAWTRDHLDTPKEEVAPALLSAFAAQTGIDPPKPVHTDAHRWLYAQVETPLGEPFLWDAAARLGLAGDWCVEPRAEAAFLSGEELGRAVTASLTR